MQISLKRALKLRKELEVVLSKIDLPLTLTVQLLDPSVAFNDSLATARGMLKDTVTQWKRLSEILSQVRADIAKKNTDYGVEQALASIAHIDRCISIARKIAAAPITPPDTMMSAEVAYAIKALTNPKTDSYREPAKTISFATVSQEIHDESIEAINELKRAREALEDDRTAKNSYSKIEITDENAELLRKIGLL